MFTAMAAMGLYRRDLRDQFLTISLRIFLSLLVGMLILYAFYLIYPDTFFNRNVFLIGVLCAFLGILFCRMLWYARKDTYLKRVMVIGAGEKAQQLEGLRRRTDRIGIDIVGYIDMPGSKTRAVSEDRIVKRVNGEPFLYAEFFEKNAVDEIVIALDERRQNFPADDILEVKMRGVHVIDVNTFLERQLGKINLDTLRPSNFIYSDGFTQNPIKILNKRILDVAVSAVLLVLTAPIMLLTALAIFIESGGKGSIIYRQERVGVKNRIFYLLKFRSMQENAEKDGVPQWASKNDTRVTWVGNFIRKTRIDELPQLFNVLKGDMSFVGPRPERPRFVEDLTKQIQFYKLRQHIKPGITGWAQICYPYGASVQDAKEKLQYDLYYLKHHSIFLDLLILLQTAAVVVLCKGSR
jgi:sugar transferase (PEP-CTERM system associated)